MFYYILGVPIFYVLALFFTVLLCRKFGVKKGSAYTKFIVLTLYVFIPVIFIPVTNFFLLEMFNVHLPFDKLDSIIFITIHTVGFCAASTLEFGAHTFVNKLKNDFKSQIGTLAGLSVFLILGLVSYFALADSTVLDAYEASGITVTESESVFAGGSMILVYILGISAVLSVVWSEVSSIIK